MGTIRLQSKNNKITVNALWVNLCIMSASSLNPMLLLGYVWLNLIVIPFATQTTLKVSLKTKYKLWDAR
jgi:hypothetical protein